MKLIKMSCSWAFYIFNTLLFASLISACRKNGMLYHETQFHISYRDRKLHFSIIKRLAMRSRMSFTPSNPNWVFVEILIIFLFRLTETIFNFLEQRVIESSRAFHFVDVTAKNCKLSI